MSKRWLDAIQADMPETLNVRISGQSMEPTYREGDKARINKVRVTDLRIGDLIFFRYGDSAFLHRYAGTMKQTVLTKGDAHIFFDEPVRTSDVLGRVETVHRDGRLLYDRTKGRVWQRILGVWHFMVGKIASALRKAKRWVAGVFVLALVFAVVTGVLASVGIVEFFGIAGADDITIVWETASETGNSGFYLERSTSSSSGFERIEVVDWWGDEVEFIYSLDTGAGAYYEVIDVNVVEGILYYYRLLDVPNDNSTGTYEGPISVGINVPTPTATATSTTGPSPTPDAIRTKATSTPTTQPSPTNTPQPTVLLWADPETVAAGDCTTVQWQVSNVKAVYFNGNPVGGIGAQTFCPCEDQTIGLVVYFHDGTSTQEEITIATTGSCTDPQSVVPTATHVPPTDTPQPTAALPGVATATPTRMIPSTPTPSPTGTFTRSPDRVVPTVTPTRVSRQPQATANPVGPTYESSDDIDRIVIETPQDSSGVSPVVWVVFASVAGIVFVGGGIWLWRRNR